MKYTIEKPMPPLWLMYPAISRYSIGWRMGYGESYRYDLGDWLKTLKEEEKKEYRKLFPLPKLWRGWYSDEVKEEDEENFYFSNDNTYIEFWRENGKPEYSPVSLRGKKNKYIFFWGHTPSKDEEIKKSCFSQWWKSEFWVDVDNYCCMEQYMMSEKARLFGDEEIREKIMKSADPREIKALGRLVKNFDDSLWNRVKYSIVLTGNYYKFMQNEELKKFLLSTGDKVLVEASPYDRVWGIGMGASNENIEKPEMWRGENLLGFALMEVRDEIRNICQNEDRINWEQIEKDYPRKKI